MFPYLWFLLLAFGIPFMVLGWLRRRDLLRYKRTVLWGLLFVYSLGWIWDWLSYRTGVWRYDSARTVGMWLGGLPVEEFVGFYLLGTLFILLVILSFLRRSNHV